MEEGLRGLSGRLDRLLDEIVGIRNAVGGQGLKLVGELLEHLARGLVEESVAGLAKCGGRIGGRLAAGCLPHLVRGQGRLVQNLHLQRLANLSGFLPKCFFNGTQRREFAGPRHELVAEEQIAIAPPASGCIHLGIGPLSPREFAVRLPLNIEAEHRIGGRGALLLAEFVVQGELRRGGLLQPGIRCRDHDRMLNRRAVAAGPFLGLRLHVVEEVGRGDGVPFARVRLAAEPLDHGMGEGGALEFLGFPAAFAGIASEDHGDVAEARDLVGERLHAVDESIGELPAGRIGKLAARIEQHEHLCTASHLLGERLEQWSNLKLAALVRIEKRPERIRPGVQPEVNDGSLAGLERGVRLARRPAREILLGFNRVVVLEFAAAVAGRGHVPLLLGGSIPGVALAPLHEVLAAEPTVGIDRRAEVGRIRGGIGGDDEQDGRRGGQQEIVEPDAGPNEEQAEEDECGLFVAARAAAGLLGHGHPLGLGSDPHRFRTAAGPPTATFAFRRHDASPPEHVVEGV